MARDLPVLCDSPVRQLVMEKGRVVGVQMEEDGSVKRAGHVIVATAAPSVGRMLPDELAEQREFFESVVQAPLPMPVFFLDRPLKRDVWAYFNEPTVKRTFSFAVDGSVKCPDMVPSGKGVRAAACACGVRLAASFQTSRPLCDISACPTSALWSRISRTCPY